MRRPLVVFGILGTLTACAGAPATTSTASPGQPAGGEQTPQPSAANDLRTLPATATFGDVVRAARNLDQASAGQSASGCLLASATQPRFMGDMLLGVRPLPAAPDGLADLFEGQPGTPTILTAWDRVTGDNAMVLAAFTTTTPSAVQGKPVTLVVTQRGTYVRSTAPVIAGRNEALPTDAVGALVTQLTAADASSAYVTADANVPLAEVRAVMRSIPDRFEIALAVVLPKGTQLPAVPARSADLLCPGGLPEPADSEAEGDIDGSALRNALAPLRDAALACASSAGGRAALGGRLVLSLRVGAEGRIAHACFSEDSMDELALRHCLVSSAHSLLLPLPSPKGFVDVALPLHIDFSNMPRQRALCD